MTEDNFDQLLANIPVLAGYSSELNRLLSGALDVEDLAKAELAMVAQFQTPDGRMWREGTIKSCFNYLLLDPRVTQNLPLRAKTLSERAHHICLQCTYCVYVLKCMVYVHSVHNGVCVFTVQL